MKYLGIDYGEKRVGIALSDDGGNIAFPKEILENDANLVQAVADLCQRERVEAVVLGESRDYHGHENQIMKQVKAFQEKLSEKITLPIFPSRNS